MASYLLRLFTIFTVLLFNCPINNTLYTGEAAYGVANAADAGWRIAPPSPDWLEDASQTPLLPDDWVVSEGTFARIHSTKKDAKIARHLATHSSHSIPKLVKKLGLPAGPTIEVVLTPTEADFRNLQHGKTPKWADGTAWPSKGMIFLKSPNIRSGSARPLEQTFDHEIVHIILGRAFAPNRPPSWLQEGMAQLLAGEVRPDATDRIGAARFGDSLLTVAEITGPFPSDPMRAQLAYAQSADLVATILNIHGQTRLAGIISEMTRGKTFAGALRLTTGSDVATLDRQWRGRIGQSASWLKPLVSDTMLFSVTGAFFLIGGGLALRKRRKQLREMGDREVAMERLMAEMAELSRVTTATANSSDHKEYIH